MGFITYPGIESKLSVFVSVSERTCIHAFTQVCCLWLCVGLLVCVCVCVQAPIYIVTSLTQATIKENPKTGKIINFCSRP